MEIKATSFYKHPEHDHAFVEDWIKRLQEANQSFYKRTEIITALGKTIIWAYNTEQNDLPALVIFPGFRTTPLFWDLDNGLSELKKKFRLYLVETNGQPNLSDGHSPSIRNQDYGTWALEVLDKLSLEKVCIAGASFGGIVCMRLCLAAPERILKAILMNPAGIRTISFSPVQLYYNLLPVAAPTVKNVQKFLDRIIFYKDHHNLPPAARNLLCEYILYTLKNFVPKAELPAPLHKEELQHIQPPLYLVLGDKDPLFPYKGTIRLAKKHIRALKGIHVIRDTGHGIETSKAALKIVADILKN